MTNKEESIIDKLCRPLSAEDVELRVGQNTANGFVLLPYKTARADVKRLNEVFGLNWQNSYHYDDNKNLCCNISVYDGNQWISRTDIGTESQAEKEKGSYSDSFKRAGFKWGIGVELYRSPFIFIPWEMEKDGNKYKPKGFFQNKLDVTEYKLKDGIPYLTITYDAKEIWSNLKKLKKDNAPQAKKEQPKQETDPKKLAEQRLNNRLGSIDKVKNQEMFEEIEKRYSAWYKDSLEHLGDAAANMLKKKFDKLSEQYSQTIEQMLDDEIPDFINK